MTRSRLRTLVAAGSVALAAVIIAASAGSAAACTRILWNDNSIGVFTSRSMDWVGTSQPEMVVFPRGITRDGGLVGGKPYVQENPARWTSKFGSVAVTALGMGVPDGMNEKGLGVHALWLNAADYGPRDPSRPGVQVGMWAQYVLDNAATVAEAVALQSQIQPVEISVGGGHRVPLSMAVEDASGDSAIIQYVNGELVVYQGAQYRVMSNDPSYSDALAELAKYDFTNATRNIPLPGNSNSLDRFVRASFYSDFLRRTKPTSQREAVTSLLSVARNVSAPVGAPQDAPGVYGQTDYRTVMDLTRRIYYFESSEGTTLLRTDLRSFDLRKGAPVLTLNPENAKLVGNVTADYRPTKRVPFATAPKR